jgi:RND family efflux transporter MFP subunit
MNIPRALTLYAMLCSAAAHAAPQEFDCMIEPAQIIDIRSPVVGIVQQVHTRRGQTIRKGDVLVTIESSVEKSAADTAQFRAQAQGALLLSQNKLRAAGEKAKRLQALFEEDFVSAQAKDDAASEQKLAESELKTAQENSQLAKLEHRQSLDQLSRRVLRSPFTGVVMDQYFYPGALVDAGEGKKPILKIAQTQPLLAQAILPFRFFPQIKPGSTVTVVPEKPFGKDITARIKTVDRVIDSAAGTFGVIAEIDNPEQSLPGGIRCKLQIPGLVDGKL